MNPSEHEDDEYLEYLGSDPVRRTLDGASLGEPISLLQPATPVCADVGTSIGDLVRLMQEHRIGCVLIVSARKLAGIFTERDLLLKVVGTVHDLESTPVDDFMTSAPEAMRAIDTVAFALNKMSLGGFRHIPVVDDAGIPVGIVSVKDIVDYIADFFGAEVQNVPPVPELVSKARDGA
jgi:CBS domain-containing protein